MHNQDKYAPRRPLEPSLASVRSAISNGSVLLHGLDHRSAWARRLRDLIAASVADLGGPDNVSNHELILIRRAAMLALQCELQEQVWAKERDGQAGPKSLDLYQRTVGALRRTLESLGIRRRAIDITPHPLDYAKRYDRQAEDVEGVA